jgi:hypothetical protein
MTTPRFTGWQGVAIVAILAATVVSIPVAVGAATGSFVNITDPVTAAQKARVNSAGALWTTPVDPTTKSQAKVVGGKLQVGDTSGAMTVDGVVDAVPGKPRTPYTITLAEEGAPGQNQILQGASVPAGKTFVIQEVTVHIAVIQGQQPGKLLVSCPTGGSANSHYQQFLFQTTSSGYDEFMATNDAAIYCDPGSTIYGGVARNGSTGYWHMYMSLSGYLA